MSDRKPQKFQSVLAYKLGKMKFIIQHIWRVLFWRKHFALYSREGAGKRMVLASHCAVNNILQFPLNKIQPMLDQ